MEITHGAVAQSPTLIDYRVIYAYTLICSIPNVIFIDTWTCRHI